MPSCTNRMVFNPADISAFLAVVRHGNVSRAAVDIGITQPSVSKALRRLEDEIGVSLFERGAHGARLTSEGHLFVESAHRFERQYAEMVRSAGEMRARYSGLLRIGVTSPASDSLPLRVLSEMIGKRPGMRVSLVIGKSDALNVAVESGDLDLAVVPSYPGYSFSCAQMEVGEDQMRVVARADHPVFAMSNAGIADLREFGWIMPNRRSVARKLMGEIFEREAAPSPRVVVEVDYVSDAVMGLIMATDLLALVPAAALRGWLGRVVPVQMPQMLIQRTFVLLSHPSGKWSPLMQTFRDILIRSRPEQIE
ncbi:LysR family transcriptional regulator [Cupriavidus sp. OTU4895]